MPIKPVCYRCQEVTSPSLICNRCRPQAGLDHLWAVSAYGGLAKQLVAALKFNRAQSVARIMAIAMVEILPYLAPNTVICPLPTANQRIRQRGYDQTELLARQIAQQTNRPYDHLLNRLGQSRQVGASRQVRQQQQAQAYQLAANTTIQPVLLVDDILTTGASVEAAARVLRQAGYKDVSATVFAHKALAGS